MADELVLLHCVQEGSKVRMKIQSPGYIPGANCQISRSIRTVGCYYTVPTADVRLTGTANKHFYRVSDSRIIKYDACPAHMRPGARPVLGKRKKAPAAKKATTKKASESTDESQYEEVEVFVELLPEKVVNSSKTKVIKKKGHPEEYETTTTKTVTTTVVRRVRRVPIEAEAEPEVEEPASPAPPAQIFCDENDSDCIVCMAVEREVVFVECGHFYCCNACFLSLPKKECPICKANIKYGVKRTDIQ